MKRHLFIVLLILIGSAVALSQVSKKAAMVQDSSKTEKEVTDAIHQRLAALRRGDAKLYASYFGDDCIITGDNGALAKPEQISAEWANDLHSGIIYSGGEPLDVQVHAYGEFAVASFRTELDQDWSGQKLLESSRFYRRFRSARRTVAPRRAPRNAYPECPACSSEGGPDCF
jgi:ketosteroid isomerase-like protein